MDCLGTDCKRLVIRRKPKGRVQIDPPEVIAPASLPWLDDSKPPPEQWKGAGEIADHLVNSCRRTRRSRFS
jgi:hypothetical protein